MASERKLERKQGTALPPWAAAQPGQQHQEDSKAPAPFAALFFTTICVSAASCRHLGWPWASGTAEGEAYSPHEAGWVLPGGRCQEFPIPLCWPGRRPGATDQLSDSGNPNRNLNGDGIFLNLFRTFRWGCLYIDSAEFPFLIRLSRSTWAERTWSDAGINSPRTLSYVRSAEWLS